MSYRKWPTPRSARTRETRRPARSESEAENREPTLRAGEQRARHALGLRCPSRQDWLMPTRRWGALPHSAPASRPVSPGDPLTDMVSCLGIPSPVSGHVNWHHTCPAPLPAQRTALWRNALRYSHIRAFAARPGPVLTWRAPPAETLALKGCGLWGQQTECKSQLGPALSAGARHMSPWPASSWARGALQADVRTEVRWVVPVAPAEASAGGWAQWLSFPFGKRQGMQTSF